MRLKKIVLWKTNPICASKKKFDYQNIYVGIEGVTLESREIAYCRPNSQLFVENKGHFLLNTIFTHYFDTNLLLIHCLPYNHVRLKALSLISIWVSDLKFYSSGEPLPIIVPTLIN